MLQHSANTIRQETCVPDAIMAQDLAAATVAAAIQKWNFYKQFFKAMFLKSVFIKKKKNKRIIFFCKK